LSPLGIGGERSIAADDGNVWKEKGAHLAVRALSFQ